MVHFDPSLMRVVLGESSLFPEDVLLDPVDPLRWNLEGTYTREIFSKTLVPQEFHRAMVVAHEQRHYLDYHLTNYGSWVSRFWGQVKQTIPALLAAPGPLVVPISYMEDELVAPFHGVTPPLAGTHQWVAVRLSANHARRVRRDRVLLPSAPHGFSGGAQLEALATTFEVAPPEALLPMEEALTVLTSMPRDMLRWQNEYVWLGDVLAALEIGPQPLGVGAGRVVNSRLWPSILVASLMGQFEHLTAENLDDDPQLWHRIMPSSRLLDLLRWLHGRYRGKIRTVEDAWEAVNEACVDLYGFDVAASLVSDVDWMARSVERHLNKAHEVIVDLDMVVHVRARMEIARDFAADPMLFVDPSDSRQISPMVADYHLASAGGFSCVPSDLTEFDSEFYASSDGRARFVKPKLGEDLRELQRVDEELSAIARFLVRGAASPSWVGPEREAVALWLASHKELRIIPPFGTDLGSLVSVS
ncbi:hypothetical protein ACI2K4_22425 [Micromonospora sp. NPDC050397]|uniref:hypothetical protein n=1 Tax=Micromonospora sp. NPDC050397 TaxID=3364279 RepID=UPI0038512F78